MWKNIAILKQNYTVKLLLFHLNENLDFLDFLKKKFKHRIQWNQNWQNLATLS